MLFNSIEFFLFFPAFFLLYWFVFNKSLKGQNLLVLIGSYLFYSFWDWRFLGLILLSTFTDFFVGIALSRTKEGPYRKAYLGLSILVNLGLLGFFKYYNFFVDSFIKLMSGIGVATDFSTLSVILPVGISFYTFQTLSYTIDIYNRKIQPTHDPIAFFSFVSFFPQLVAGPIERASNLLPQFLARRQFNYNSAVSGVELILYGLFKKVVIADNCGEVVDIIFSPDKGFSGMTYFLGSVFFAIQIYGDFSGYSDVAIGAGRMLGIDLMRNFNKPYFSTTLGEFWHRWHISLSTWFRDYVYIPLGGNKIGPFRTYFNIFIVFLVSGLWHGANWTFVVWGGFHGLFLGVYRYLGIDRIDLNKTGLKRFVLVMITFFLVVMLWVFFRAPTLEFSFHIIHRILFTSWYIDFVPKVALIISVLFFILEFSSRNKETPFGMIEKKPYKYFLALFFSYLILFNMSFHDEAEFIYFQF